MRRLVLGLLVATAVPAGAGTWSGRLSPGQTIEVWGISGAIHATAGRDASVTYGMRARRSDTASVHVKVVEHAGGVTLCAIYPGMRDDSCRPGEGPRGDNNVRDNDVAVDFQVQVPSGVKVDLNTVNGDVEARGLDADAEVATVNGDVEVETSGGARAATVNGSLHAAMGQADWQGELAMSTVNGTVRVELPADASTDVRASTVNGSIESDFPLEVSGRHGPRHARGTIGHGGRSLELETVNGAIELRKR